MDEEMNSLFGDLFHDAIVEKGRAASPYYLSKTTHSIIPGKLPSSIHDLTENLTLIERILLPSMVKKIFGVDLDVDDAIYFVMYIGAVSSIKRNIAIDQKIDSTLNGLRQAALDGQLTLIQLASELNFPATRNGLTIYLRDHQENFFLKDECRVLLTTLDLIDKTTIETKQLKVDAEDVLYTIIGITSSRSHSAGNPQALEDLAENYFKRQFSIAFYCPN